MKAKKTNRPKLMPYPKPEGTEAGCKVAWNFYNTEAEARECAKAAEHNAAIKAAEGFDFGYQVPGTIDHNPRAKLYRVCLP